MVIQIAKAELRNLFYSPVAWFLAIVFLVMSGYAFTEGLYQLTKMQETMKYSSPDFKDFGPLTLTLVFLHTPGSIFSVMLKNSYFFVPLLTMGLIGREIQAGTIKLLYSSPVKLWKVIIGKFLAVMMYNVMLLMILSVYLIILGCSIRSADYGLFIAGMIAFYLLICTYAAIGLFMSSLTTYQVVAAIGTFLVIFVLTKTNGLWQQYDLVRDLTYFLYLPGRIERLLKGLIVSKDIIYYVMMVFMFLGFTYIRLRKQRESKPWYVTTMRIMVVVIITLSAGYLFSLPKTSLYLDTTATRANTIHPKTQALLEEMKGEPLEVTLYTNLLGGEGIYGFPAARNIYRGALWEQYLRFNTNIHFKYVYYYYYEPEMDGGHLARIFPDKSNEEMAREFAKGMQVNFDLFSPISALKEMPDLEPEKYRLIMQLKYKGRTEFLRTYQSAGKYPDVAPAVYPHEQNMAAALKRLLHPEGIPKVLYTSGNLERKVYGKGERDYMRATTANFEKNGPVNLGFDVDTISLEKQDIPAGITALVVADPKVELSGLSQQKLKKYIDEGGNIMFMGEPGKQNVLNPLLKYMGVEMLGGTVVEPTYHEKPDMVKPYYTAASAELADELLFKLVKAKMKRVYDKDTLKMLMPGVTGISFTDSSGFVKKPLLLTVGSSSWLKKGKLVVDSADVVYNAAEGDVRGAFSTSLQLYRQIGNKQQRAVIYGDADFLVNERLKNGEAIHRAALYWLSENEYPVYVPREDAKDNLINLSSGTAKKLKLIFVWILPALVLVAGTVLLVRRKRK
ncbi:Gldg family protein [Pseudobacter ginsenosidimutans]|nr:Gldg family protein [Pseudobacter ginsenosidimutans]